jgi:glucans biosynthesis protein
MIHVRLTYGPAESLPGHVRLFPTRANIAPKPSASTSSHRARRAR